MRKEPVVLLSVGYELCGWAGELALAASCWVFTEGKSSAGPEVEEGAVLSIPFCRLWQTPDLDCCQQGDAKLLCRTCVRIQGAPAPWQQRALVFWHTHPFFSAWWQAVACQEMAGPGTKAEFFASLLDRASSPFRDEAASKEHRWLAEVGSLAVG